LWEGLASVMIRLKQEGPFVLCVRVCGRGIR